MTTLTIYFCGTGSTKFDDTNGDYWDGELISTLAANSLGKEFAEWVVIDGPGSGNLQADELFTEAGGYGWTGTAFGFGWDENVRHAVNIIKGRTDWQREKLTENNYEQLKTAGIPIEEVHRVGSWFWRTYDYGNRLVTQQQLQEQIIKIFRADGLLPTQVNLVGWSRGGISCNMLANAMLDDQELKNIPVRILALDPVPGPINFQEKRVSLGENVKEYVGFFARDERSTGFSCVVPITSPDTQIYLYPMAGRHATLVGNAAANGEKGPKALPEPGLVVRHCAEAWLTRWGVSLAKRLDLSTAQLSELYQVINAKYGDFLRMRKTAYTFCEDVYDERSVSLGNESKRFSEIDGLRTPLLPLYCP